MRPTTFARSTSSMIALSLSSLLFVVSSLAVADPGKGNGHGKHKEHHKPAQQQVQTSGSGSASTVDAQLSVQIGGVNLSIGTAKQLAGTYQVSGAKPLPPGIRKQLARGKALPPGLARQQLPRGYVEQLPVRDGCEWSRVGTDLVLVAIATGVVVELLSDVF